MFIPNYEFPKGEVLNENLKLLIKRRNAIAHPKVEIKIDDEIIHKGNVSESHNNEIILHLNFCDLPEQLVDNLKKYDRSQAFELEIFLTKDKAVKKAAR